MSQKDSLIWFDLNFGSISVHLCTVCGFKTTLQKMKVHTLKVHGIGDPYLCKECGKTFNSPVVFKRHKRAVHESKKVICDQCGKSLKNREYLYVHNQTVHGKRKYECKICSTQFITRSQFCRHVFCHSGRMNSFETKTLS